MFISNETSAFSGNRTSGKKRRSNIPELPIHFFSAIECECLRHTLCVHLSFSPSSMVYAWHELNYTHVQHKYKSKGLSRFSQWNEVWFHIKFRCIWISRSPNNNSRFDRKQVQKPPNSGRNNRSSRSPAHRKFIYMASVVYDFSENASSGAWANVKQEKEGEAVEDEKTNVPKVNAINGRCQCVCVALSRRWWWCFCFWCFCGISVRTRSQKYCTQLTYVTAKHVFPFHVVIGFVSM